MAGLQRPAGRLSSLCVDYFDSNQLCASLAQLNNYRFSNPYIDSIYIYNGNLNSLQRVPVSLNLRRPSQGRMPFLTARLPISSAGRVLPGSTNPSALIRYQNTKKNSIIPT